MILALKQLGTEKRILVNTDFVALIKPATKGSNIVLTNVPLGDSTIPVQETPEEIFGIFKK